MQIKLISDSFVSPILTSPVNGKVYDLADDAARHLVDAGVAIYLKVEAATVKKPLDKAITSASLPGQVSQQPTAKKRGRPRKKPLS